MASTPSNKKTQTHAHVLLCIKATSNNTLISVTTVSGNVLFQTSSGMFFKGSRKSTAYAAQKAGEEAAKKASAIAVQTVDVLLKGFGLGRDSAVRAFQGFKINFITERTAIPNGGCKPPKQRRN